ncbi:MAG: isoprenylcysteine carboxylmethyltransferase family protein [Nevskiales bacterium]|nr:isoprenylcysteine carboxylmethyltransferase family protein [Nevskiales bacterium]
MWFARHRIAVSRLLVAALLIMIAITGSLWNTTLPLVGKGLVALGLFLVGIAMVGRLWCNLYIVGYKNSSLLTVGPYSMSRNPLYFFSAIGGIGVALTTGTIAFAVAVALIFALTYPGVIRSEEARLRKLYGTDWEDYARKVPRFMPRLQQLTEPTEYVAHPRLFRRHLMDALWFAWASAAVLLVGELQTNGILPTLFRFA